MIDWPAGPPLDGDIAPRIGVDGMDGSGDANSDFCAMLLAMASHDLRQPLQAIVSAHDVLARILHGSAAQAQLARVKDATRQQRTARCHRGQQDRDPMAHAGSLHATPSVCGGRYCDP